MFFRTISLLTPILAFLALPVPAGAADVTAKYLVGTWAVASKKCDDAKGEFVTFRQNGAVESMESGKLDAAGFWSVGAGGIVTMELITSPAFFHEDPKIADASFFAVQLRVVPVNVKDDGFEAIGILGEEVRREPFKRCGKG